MLRGRRRPGAARIPARPAASTRPAPSRARPWRWRGSPPPPPHGWRPRRRSLQRTGCAGSGSVESRHVLRRVGVAVRGFAFGEAGRRSRGRETHAAIVGGISVSRIRVEQFTQESHLALSPISLSPARWPSSPAAAAASAARSRSRLAEAGADVCVAARKPEALEESVQAVSRDRAPGDRGADERARDRRAAARSSTRRRAARPRRHPRQQRRHEPCSGRSRTSTSARGTAIMNTNVKSLLLPLEDGARRDLEHGEGGSIINVSSTGGLRASTGSAATRSRRRR